MVGKEIEFKYYANHITSLDFCKLCEKFKPDKAILVWGKDLFFGCDSKPDSFFRYRAGDDMRQLTYKRKTHSSNNYVRIEHNIDLTDKIDEGQIKDFCNELGYKYNTYIYKYAFIFKYEKYTLVYYICDRDGKEIGRFVEIEMSEDYPWNSDKEALFQLKRIEKKLKFLGIDSTKRVKESLWELFRQ